MIIGVGCDIVAIARIKKAMQKEGFLRILTQEEQTLYEAVGELRKGEWLAGRFAAKEAIVKAFANECEFTLGNISIGYQGKQPACHVDGYRIHISISHEIEYAIAYAIVEKD